PADWYWYVDPATNTLHFAEASASADITLIKGRHLNSLEIEATKEDIKNVVYFTGGDDGTGTNTNVFVLETATKGSNRFGLSTLSDNRISAAAAGSLAAAQALARLLAQNELSVNASETYITNVVIIDGTMDISSISLGMMVGFSGFGTFVDRLLLQVVSITREPEQVTLGLGTLPKRSARAVADVQTALTYQQTIDNPAQPS
ncbi:MAG TPA: hypothetical protein VN039_03745, partial [Nitrospira sp.]|nr:hypothetical protein [Nitrospira sp.]